MKSTLTLSQRRTCISPRQSNGPHSRPDRLQRKAYSEVRTAQTQHYGCTESKSQICQRFRGIPDVLQRPHRWDHRNNFVSNSRGSKRNANNSGHQQPGKRDETEICRSSNVPVRPPDHRSGHASVPDRSTQPVANQISRQQSPIKRDRPAVPHARKKRDRSDPEGPCFEFGRPCNVSRSSRRRGHRRAETSKRGSRELCSCS